MRAAMRWIICVTFLAPSLAAQPRRVDSTRITEAAQDSTGQVWGVAYYADLGLYRWENESWKPVAVYAVPGGALPFALARGPDGAVYVVWSADANTHAVTRHIAASSQVLAKFSGHLADRPRIFFDPGGNIWITEQGRHIFRVSPQGKAESVYTIADSQFHDYGRPADDQSGFNPIFATVDGHGRVWFWSASLATGTNLASLEGVLIYDGQKFAHHPHIGGVADKKYSIVEPDDSEHVWVAVLDDGLYRVDANTLEAKHVPEPGADAFRFVQRIFTIRHETYVVSGPGWLPVPERSGDGRSSALWRLRDGKWTRIMNGLDMRPEYAQQPIRPFLATEQGLWLGTFGSGPWFIPTRPGRPALIDWRYGYSLDGSESLFQIPDGRLLFIASNRGSMAAKPAELLASFQSPPEVQTLNPARPFIQDVRGHILGILATGDNVLDDWDGKTWTERALPVGFDPAHFWIFVEDSLSRIWLLPDLEGKPVVIFDPREGTSEIYASYADALQAQLPRRDAFHLDGEFSMAPSFTRDGRIGFHDEWDGIRYFDGRRWLSWERPAIDGSNEFYFDGPAFFNRAGNLAVNINGKTWEFTEPGGWRSTSFEPGLGTDSERQAMHLPPAPPGCEFGNPESVVQDRLGTYWLTHHGQLYRALLGICLPQFSPEEHRPFTDSRTVKKVLIDPEGNAFLESYFYSNPLVGEYVILKCRQPVPKTSVRAAVEPSGTVKLGFDARAQGKVWFTWRLDGGAWSPPSQKPEALIEWLPNGEHRIEAAAIGDRLQIDPKPAEVRVEIRVNPTEQLPALINKLADPDFSVREAALAALVRQADLARPFLRAAREKAGPDQRWWIDAAMQQIEEHLPTSKKP
jgi:streptogramin lyase